LRLIQYIIFTELLISEFLTHSRDLIILPGYNK